MTASHISVSTVRARATRLRRQRGISLIELMIGITIGLVLLTALASLYYANSLSRTEFAKAAEQVENGRYALEQIRREVELAGFFGVGNIARGNKAAEPALCATDPAALGFSPIAETVPVALAGYAPGVVAPCLPDLAPTSEVLVVRRVSTTPVVAPAPGSAYLQVSACSQDAQSFVFDASGAAAFGLRTKACDAAQPAELRRAMVRIFYLAGCDRCSNGGDGIPTLKMAELVNGVFQARSVAQGVQDMHVLYGVDQDSNGSADCYVTDPRANNSAVCTAVPGYDWGVAINNLANVTTVRVHLLARTLKPSGGHTDNRTYEIGRAAAAGPFNDGYKRHVYAQVARLVNVAGLREQ
ncbi:PilW family protein [Cupriavidus sp. WGtm5]|uniref:PilW family protein n=1 Tax=Cupriavidus sp. WGtm5 TaxID=2919926 RepID=UPI0020904315|nr:PilW family protein [Cupriavidus sp. WGtm5]MCO4889977.1 PilW family protein [Cupriavidus sp. WGtm5]